MQSVGRALGGRKALVAASAPLLAPDLEGLLAGLGCTAPRLAGSTAGTPVASRAGPSREPPPCGLPLGSARGTVAPA